MPEQPLVERFVAALGTIPAVQAKLVQETARGQLGDKACDARVELSVAGKFFVLLVETKKSVFPRDARQLIWKFEAAAPPDPGIGSGRFLAVVAAESISPGARELLLGAGVGFYDGGGSLCIPVAGAYIYIDRPPSKVLGKSMRTLFSGRRTQVLHALLVQHEHWFGVRELATLAMVSPATASQVLVELERLDWVESRGQGPGKQRHLQDPAAVLDEWAKHLAAVRPPVRRRYYVPGTKAETLLARIGGAFDSHAAQYAISHEAAAQRHTPFLSNISQVRAWVLPDSRAHAAIRALDARDVTEGANFMVMEAGTPGDLLFREQVGGLWLASHVQIYLDLLRGEGRSREMAEHFRQERIGF